jgi:PleD family two-component response regulator
MALLLCRASPEPVRAITAAVRRVGAGDYSPIPESRRRDEIGELSRVVPLDAAGIAANMSRLTELAHRDPLTGLPTRVLFATGSTRRLPRARAPARPSRC